MNTGKYIRRYRFTFNGKESDSEWYSTSGSISDYGFRIYNPRIGKFLSVDPLTKEYPWYTPYQFAGNKPILAVDLDGLEEEIFHYKWDAENSGWDLVLKTEGVGSGVLEVYTGKVQPNGNDGLMVFTPGSGRLNLYDKMEVSTFSTMKPYANVDLNVSLVPLSGGNGDLQLCAAGFEVGLSIESDLDKSTPLTIGPPQASIKEFEAQVPIPFVNVNVSVNHNVGDPENRTTNVRYQVKNTPLTLETSISESSVRNFIGLSSQGERKIGGILTVSYEGKIGFESNTNIENENN